MFDFTSLLFPLILTWMLTFTDAQTFRNKNVRVGDEVTLKCGNANDFSDGCSWITWLYSNSTNPATTLFEHGKILKDVGSKSDRLNVTEKCSLVIKKITDEDAGTYNCRQFSTSGQMETEFQVQLTVRNADSSATTGSVLQTLKPSAAPDNFTNTNMTAVIITAAVIVAACILVVVMLMGWRRIKERKTKIEANMAYMVSFELL
ncbi:uncharacterized protein LOC112159423 [Oryzias melastigma]|uniref:uncharacterized protein LOC112159423 n=1 Tax=Oryzias melastigma TaxID=30732 RepID=UPI00168CF535|nr:uncharacterized protein LOC112159423 [Oryzias melastigma]